MSDVRPGFIGGYTAKVMSYDAERFARGEISEQVFGGHLDGLNQVIDFWQSGRCASGADNLADFRSFLSSRSSIVAQALGTSLFVARDSSHANSVVFEGIRAALGRTR